MVNFQKHKLSVKTVTGLIIIILAIIIGTTTIFTSLKQQKENVKASSCMFDTNRDSSLSKAQNETDLISVNYRPENIKSKPKYTGTISFKAPRKWNAEIVDNLLLNKCIYAQLDKVQRNNPGHEVGFFLTKHCGEMKALFYIGKSSTSWLSFSDEAPEKFAEASDGQHVVGFYHTHLFYDWHRWYNPNVLQFSGDDCTAFYYLITHGVGWANNKNDNKQFVMGVVTSVIRQVMTPKNYFRARRGMHGLINGCSAIERNNRVWRVYDWSKFGFSIKSY